MVSFFFFFFSINSLLGFILSYVYILTAIFWNLCFFTAWQTFEEKFLGTKLVQERSSALVQSYSYTNTLQLKTFSMS